MKKVELLAPAGNYEAFLGAIHAGADAVYLGGEKYSARAYADNFTDEEVISAIRYAHLFGKKVYMTINTLMKENECKALCEYVKPFYGAGLDGVIIQDMGAFFALKEAFPNLELHASTQMTLTGELGVSYLKEIGACRVVPARELSLNEIKNIKEKVDIEIECFVHGAMCYCYSGQCLFSSILGGRSGNRGRCAQPCRLPYSFSKNGKESYPLSLKDMCTITFVPELIEAGIDSFKIEGRMKKPEYAAGVTAIYRKYIDLYYARGKEGFKVSKEDMDNLSKLYIRSEIQDGYYFRHNGKEMITPSKPSYLGSDEVYLADIRKNYIENGKKIPVELFGEFRVGCEAVLSAKYGDIFVTVTGNVVDKAQKRPMTKEDIEKQLLKLGNTCFSCENLYIDFYEDIFIPNKTLNDLRRAVLLKLEDEIIKNNGFDAKRYDFKLEEVSLINKKIPADKKEFIITVSTKEQLYALKKYKNYFGRVNLEYTLVLDLSQDELNELKKEWTLGVVYPRIIRKQSLDLMEQLYEKSKDFSYAIIKNLETLQFLKNKDFAQNVIGDYTCYVFNSKSAVWAANNLKGICYPVELNRGEILQIEIPNGLHTEQLVYSYLPLMVTANCLKKTTDRCGQKNSQDIIYDRYNKAFVSKSHCRLCYSEIYNCVPMSLHKYLKEMKHSADSYRIDFTIEDSKMTEQVLALFFEAASMGELNEYTTGHYKRGVE